MNRSLRPAADLAPLLELLERADRANVDPAVQRAEYTGFIEMFRDPAPPFAGTISDEVFPGSADDGVAVRCYRPDVEHNPGHVLVYFHGGGWVLGSTDTHDRFTRAIAERLGLQVVSVDYRLAPEHPFPAAFDDCAAVVTGLQYSATWLAVAGDSAGGNLAAAVAAARTAAGSPVDAQVLIYPGLSVPQPIGEASSETDGYGLDRSDIDYFWASYSGTHEVDMRLAPLLASDPLDAPPTVVTTAGFDPLRPDGERYAARLVESGVHTIYLPFPGLVHGWLDVADRIPSAGRARDTVIEAIAGLHTATSARTQEV
jgi:acetyl esterase